LDQVEVLDQLVVQEPQDLQAPPVWLVWLDRPERQVDLGLLALLVPLVHQVARERPAPRVLPEDQVLLVQSAHLARQEWLGSLVHRDLPELLALRVLRELVAVLVLLDPSEPQA